MTDVSNTTMHDARIQVQTPPIPEQIEERADTYWLVVIALVGVFTASAWLYYGDTGPAAEAEQAEALISVAGSAPRDRDTRALQIQGTSDDPADIHADAEATDLAGLDREVAFMEAELAR